MSLYVDPQLAEDYDEPPYTEHGPRLFAPAAPFGEAITDWLGAHVKQLEANPFHNIGQDLRDLRRRKARRQQDISHGIGELARRARVDPAQLKRWMTGRAQWIELRAADNLAMALGIPLSNLADEFRPQSETLNATGQVTKRRRRQERQAA